MSSRRWRDWIPTAQIISDLPSHSVPEVPKAAAKGTFGTFDTEAPGISQIFQGQDFDETPVPGISRIISDSPEHSVPNASSTLYLTTATGQIAVPPKSTGGVAALAALPCQRDGTRFGQDELVLDCAAQIISDLPEHPVPKVPKPALSPLPEVWITWAEWQAVEINRIFAQHGTCGAGRINAATILDGLSKKANRKTSNERPPRRQEDCLERATARLTAGKIRRQHEHV